PKDSRSNASTRVRRRSRWCPRTAACTSATNDPDRAVIVTLTRAGMPRMPRQPPNISNRRFRTSDGSWTPSLSLMTTFGLVHGAWRGAWCWERLTPLLQQAGHDAVAMDLPIDDNTASFDTQADVVCDALDDCGEEVVAVGHSYGGNSARCGASARSALG